MLIYERNQVHKSAAIAHCWEECVRKHFWAAVGREKMRRSCSINKMLLLIEMLSVIQAIERKFAFYEQPP